MTTEKKEFIKVDHYTKVESELSEQIIKDIQKIDPEYDEKSMRILFNRGQCFLLAYQGKQPLGFVKYFLPGMHPKYNDGIVTIKTVVRPDLRKRGLMRKMTYHLLGYANSKGVPLYREAQGGTMARQSEKMRISERRSYTKKGKMASNGKLEEFDWAENRDLKITRNPKPNISPRQKPHRH
ncbi:MAG: GNAT family N-acetyltransferase [archaeon]|nr:GNAT family N-acetyltransferase [archaeon]